MHYRSPVLGSGRVLRAKSGRAMADAMEDGGWSSSRERSKGEIRNPKKMSRVDEGLVHMASHQP